MTHRHVPSMDNVEDPGLVVLFMEGPENIPRSQREEGNHWPARNRDMKEVNKEFDAKMQKTIDVVMSDFASVRAGRANAAVSDKITVTMPHASEPGSGYLLPRPQEPDDPARDSTLLKAIEKGHPDLRSGINNPQE